MPATDPAISRRSFVRTAALAGAATWFASRAGAAAAESAVPLFSAMGLSGPLAKAARLKELGARFLTVGTSDFLVPDQPDEVFARSLAKLAASPLPVLACNGFIRPPHLHCVGAEANHELVLAWAEPALRRLQLAAGKFIVFGSGSARAVPDGWPRAKAEEQFVALLKRMGPLAENHGVTVVVEQLQASECNFINHIAEGAALIRAAGHPNIRMNADLYHMARMGDTPADLRAAMDVVRQVEIAEKDDRTYPGIHGDDFRPWFRVLRDSGYHGAISIEGHGTDAQLGAAFKEIATQAASC